MNEGALHLQSNVLPLMTSLQEYHAILARNGNATVHSELVSIYSVVGAVSNGSILRVNVPQVTASLSSPESVDFDHHPITVVRAIHNAVHLSLIVMFL